MFCTYACQHKCILNTHASRTMNRLPADVVAERAAANETREPAPGNPAARRPRSGSPRTPTAHQWQLMRDPTASFAGPQSPRAKILQSKAARGGGDTQRDLDLSCSAANVAWQAHVCGFFSARNTCADRFRIETRSPCRKRQCCRATSNSFPERSPENH